MYKSISNAINQIDKIDPLTLIGKVLSIKGLLIEAEGLSHITGIGDKCFIKRRDGETILADVIGFRDNLTLLTAYDKLEGVGTGCDIIVQQKQSSLIYPCDEWLGRVINCHCQPLDGKGLIIQGDVGYSIYQSPPPAHQRKILKDRAELGIKTINTMLNCCYGQRMGIFAGSGVGKSVLISMINKYAAFDVKIIGLIGERGREIQEFIHEYLGEGGLENTIIVVATGDEAALAKKQAAYLTMAVAEYFRNQNKQVLCIIDSITRFAMALREIGLSIGEPPTTKGYTPSVFAELPKLLERAGPGIEGVGDITGLFSVLVDGDDHNEPVADAIRGILDGHIVMDRKIADRGRFPAINLLKSISRTMPKCNTPEELRLLQYTKSIISTYEDMEDMIKIGAYKHGTNPMVDQAIKLYPYLEQFFSQQPNESFLTKESYTMLENILTSNSTENKTEESKAAGV